MVHRERSCKLGQGQERGGHLRGEGDWQLTTAKKKEILLNNILGVDIDAQAVEVTKLSLLLKVLEKPGQLDFTGERVLPDLGSNIQCGNSLIGPDYYEGRMMVDDEERARVNAFDWKAAFPQVFAQGGFDVVIGNPPYIDSEWLTRTNPELRTYCNQHYDSARGNWDIFCVFIEKALELCRAPGLSSMIVPNKLLAANYARALRRLLIGEHSVLSIRDYSSVPVFPVAVYPIVGVFGATGANAKGKLVFEVMEKNEAGLPTVRHSRSIDCRKLSELADTSWSGILGGSAVNLSEKIRSNTVPLGSVSKVVGAATVSEAYEYKELLVDAKSVQAADFPFINTGTIDRYAILWGRKPTTYIKSRYLRPTLPKALQGRLSKNRLDQTRAAKVIVGGMNKRLECTLDSGGILAGKSTSIVFGTSMDLRFILGLLNSRLLSYYYRLVFSGLSLQGGFLRIGPPQLKEMPVRRLDFSD